MFSFFGNGITVDNLESSLTSNGIQDISLGLDYQRHQDGINHLKLDHDSIQFRSVDRKYQAVIVIGGVVNVQDLVVGQDGLYITQANDRINFTKRGVFYSGSTHSYDTVWELTQTDKGLVMGDRLVLSESVSRYHVLWEAVDGGLFDGLSVNAIKSACHHLYPDRIIDDSTINQYWVRVYVGSNESAGCDNLYMVGNVDGFSDPVCVGRSFSTSSGQVIRIGDSFIPKGADTEIQLIEVEIDGQVVKRRSTAFFWLYSRHDLSVQNDTTNMVGNVSDIFRIDSDDFRGDLGDQGIEYSRSLSRWHRELYQSADLLTTEDGGVLEIHEDLSKKTWANASTDLSFIRRNFRHLDEKQSVLLQSAMYNLAGGSEDVIRWLVKLLKEGGVVDGKQVSPRDVYKGIMRLNDGLSDMEEEMGITDNILAPDVRFGDAINTVREIREDLDECNDDSMIDLLFEKASKYGMVDKLIYLLDHSDMFKAHPQDLTTPDQASARLEAWEVKVAEWKVDNPSSMASYDWHRIPDDQWQGDNYGSRHGESEVKPSLHFTGVSSDTGRRWESPDIEIDDRESIYENTNDGFDTPFALARLWKEVKEAMNQDSSPANRFQDESGAWG